MSMFNKQKSIDLGKAAKLFEKLIFDNEEILYFPLNQSICSRRLLLNRELCASSRNKTDQNRRLPLARRSCPSMSGHAFGQMAGD